MTRKYWKYRFRNNCDLRDARQTLLLAFLATEGLFGRTRTRMESEGAYGAENHSIYINADTLVGMTVSLIFTAFITLEFGAASFDVRQASLPSPSTSEPQA